MISRTFAIVALFLITAVVTAQPPQNPPAPDRLERHLQNLETRIKSLDSFIAKLERRETAKDGSVRVLTGQARFLKPNYAALQMIRQDNPNLFEMYILSGVHFYEYRVQTKEIWYRKLESADPKSQMNIVALLGGITAEKVRQEYDWKLLKDDEKVIHIVVEPKPNAARREFARAELLLITASMLPQQIKLEQINGSVIDWKVISMDTQSLLKPADFAPPQPTGWKLVEAPKAPNGPAGNPPAK